MSGFGYIDNNSLILYLYAAVFHADSSNKS